MSRRILGVRACDVTAILIGERVNPLFLRERKCTGGVIGFCFGGIYGRYKKNSVVGFCEVIIKMIVYGCFFMNVESFYSVKMNKFFSEIL